MGGRMETLTLPAETVGPIARGHPWVYADGLGSRPPTGTPVRLVDGRGRTVAFGLADDGDIAVHVLARHPETLDALVARRMADASSLRERVVPDATDAYRLVNGPGDGLSGIVVDRYGPALVLRLYARAWEPHLALVVQTLEALHPGTTVLRKLGVRKVDDSSGIEHLAGPPVTEPLVVEEHGLRFLVRPSTGQKTGLFLDQRENRRQVARWTRDLGVTNLFAYTGGFSVHAAAAGARRVVSVDIAADALSDAKENFRLNGLHPDRHAFEVADAFHWTGVDDLVICDPPSLSHDQSADAGAAKAYRELAETVGRLVHQGGFLATSSCTARLSQEEWERAVRDGLRAAGRWSVLHRATEPADHPVLLQHPEGRYLKLLVLAKHGRRAVAAV
jgi:23S rRNA (cytosine1962-C5)-methyltransferase